MVEVIGFDHIYISVSDIAKSESYYDGLMKILGFNKSGFQLGNEDHIQYFNRYFGYVLRPARTRSKHDPYSPGLHHICLRVDNTSDIDAVYTALKNEGYETSIPKFYQEYAPDYYAIFLSDPDGIRLEITNYRNERKERHDNWNHEMPQC